MKSAILTLLALGTWAGHLHSEDELPRQPGATAQPKPNIGRRDLVPRFEGKEGMEGKRAQNAAQAMAVDEPVGRVRAALEAKGIDQDTLIIFTSDQGSLFEWAPYRGGKRVDTLCEGGWKLLGYRSGKLSLYNVAKDRGEKNDLAEPPPEKARELVKTLRTWEKEMGVEQYSAVQ